MSRLVEKVNLPIYGEMYVACVEDASIESMQALQEPLKKLYEYEQEEEKNLLVKIPCSEGNSVWILDKGKIYQMKVVKVDPFGVSFSAETWNIHTIGEKNKTIYKSFYDIGTTVFLSEEEAEQRLKEMEKNIK